MRRVAEGRRSNGAANKKKPLTRASFAEKLGGVVTDEWRKATYLVGDDVDSDKAQDVLASGYLLFSSNFLVQCMAQERVVNAGPFILHQTVVRDEARPDDDEPQPLPSPAQLSKKSGRRGKRAAAASAAEDDSADVGQLVAMLEDMSSAEGEWNDSLLVGFHDAASPRYPKRGARAAAVAAAAPPFESSASSPPPSPAPASGRSAKKAKPTPRSSAKEAKAAAPPSAEPSAKKTRKLQPARKTPAKTSAKSRAGKGSGKTPGKTPGKRGLGRQLGVETAPPERLEELVGEFEDFVPNRNGALVTPKTPRKK
jgi:hypothetical protein